MRGSSAVVQRNAVTSWISLKPSPEVLLLGDEEGVAELARELGCVHVPKIRRNEHGTPLLNDLFRITESVASHSLLCYINSDIMLMSDFAAAVMTVKNSFEHFLLISHRVDVELNRRWDFSQADWESQLRNYMAQHRTPVRVDSSDFFVFPKGLFPEIPPFAVGRGTWDNWLIYHARKVKIPVVDATPSILALHHIHDFRHIQGGSGHPLKGPEGLLNDSLYDGAYCYGLYDATHRLTARGTQRAFGYKYLIARLSKCRLTRPLLKLAVQLRDAVRNRF